MANSDFGTFQTRRWLYGMRWMVKHDSSRPPTSAKMENTQSSAPTTDAAFFTTQRCPLVFILKIVLVKIVLISINSEVDVAFPFSVPEIEIPHSDSREINQRKEQSGTQNYRHRTFAWRKQGSSLLPLQKHLHV